MHDPALTAYAPLVRAASRDERFAAMAKAHVDVVWRTLTQLGVADGSVDDAVQQVLLIALKKFDEIHVGRERGYLLGVAVRVASHARRAARRRREVPMDDAVVPETSAPADTLLDKKRALAELDAALKEMPDENREAFVLFELEELSAPEVAEALGIPIGTVASRVRRARTLIREKLGGGR